MQCSDFFLRKHVICNLKNLRYIEQRKKEDEECEKDAVEPKGWAVGVEGRDDNLLACAHPQMREILSKCGSCGALFPCLPGVSSTATEWRPRHCCERSRAAALSLDKAGNPNALLLCIVRGEIKKQGGVYTHKDERRVTPIVRFEHVDDDATLALCHFALVKREDEPCWSIL